MEESPDAYGALVLAHFEGREAHEIIERDDGLIEVNAGPAFYFSSVRRWPAVERRALRWARGRCLDVGAGAGRVALELQRRGREVVAIVVAPSAVYVARRRGVRNTRVLSLAEIDASLGRFDTVLMYGNGFGLVGDLAGAARTLTRLVEVTTAAGRILACSLDPYRTDDPLHLRYQAENRRRGRSPGQVRIRLRHRAQATPWMEHLLVSPEELVGLADGTGWRVERVISDAGPLYVGVLEKSERSSAR